VKALKEAHPKLQTFRIDSGSLSSMILRWDTNNNEFKISNSAVITAVIEIMKNILNGKIEDVQE
jgi:hypothetical protein